jgi:hypothetical protein
VGAIGRRAWGKDSEAGRRPTIKEKRPVTIAPLQAGEGDAAGKRRAGYRRVPQGLHLGDGRSEALPPARRLNRRQLGDRGRV